MYCDHYDYGTDCYDPPEHYYDPEALSYEPEPYDDLQPVYGDSDVHYEDTAYEDTPEPEFDGDCGDGYAADIPPYAEDVVEDFFEDAESKEEMTEQGHTRYELHDYSEFGANRERAHAPECVEPLLGCDLEHATEVEMDAIAWRAVFAHGPPADSSPDTWYDEMDMWRLRIVADADAETAASAQDIVAMPESLEPLVQASWIAAKLDELQDALQRGEIDCERYGHEHDEWLEDEAEDQRLQAEGWAYDEEQGDYWHPVHGWGEEYDPEVPTNTLSSLLDSTANSDELPPFADMLSPPPNFPAAPDFAADIEQFPPLLYIAPELYELTSLEPDAYEPSHLARATLARVEAHPFAFTTPPRSLHHKPPQFAIQCPTQCIRLAIGRHLQNTLPTTSAVTGAYPPPHLETSRPSAARDPGEPPDTPMTKAIQAVVAHSAIANAPPPVDPVPPDIPLSSSLGTPSSLISSAKLARFSRAPPVSTVHATALPVPPDIPRTCPSATLSSERRCNALRRLSKKGKG
ncbi:hypothetical protein K438DRAFT_2025404 [Mycena galopus ATCC 62051]|nr:hypothetical protein K438DRAFT_2025404 [Mycena galopus ATCC 62051]